jgi:hypothetical protein
MKNARRDESVSVRAQADSRQRVVTIISPASTTNRAAGLTPGTMVAPIDDATVTSNQLFNQDRPSGLQLSRTDRKRASNENGLQGKPRASTERQNDQSGFRVKGRLRAAAQSSTEHA